MGHTFTKHLYHIVCSTKQRRPLIKERIREELRRYLCGIARNTQGKILNVNGVDDHLHILASIKPSIAVSDFVRTIKANSSRWASERLEFDWQDGYSSLRSAIRPLRASVLTSTGRRSTIGASPTLMSCERCWRSMRSSSIRSTISTDPCLCRPLRGLRLTGGARPAG